MLRRIKYRWAVAHAVAVKEATELKNRSKIDAELQEYSEYRETERLKGTNFDVDGGFMGRTARKERIERGLRDEILKCERNISDVHTTYLFTEADRLGVPRPDKKESDHWLSSYERYFFSNGVEEIDSRELLSGSGIHTLRAALRRERKERFEPWKDRASLVFGVGGLVIAALTLTLRILEVSVSRPPPSPPTQPVAAPPQASPVPAAPSPDKASHGPP